MRAVLLTVALLLSACGDAPARAPASGRQALTQQPERLAEAPRAQRAAWLEELLRGAHAEAGQSVTAQSLFPLLLGERAVSAPALDTHADLLAAAPSHPARLALEGRGGWGEQREEALGGLSEREAAELVARSLLSRWGIPAAGPVQVDRAAGVPYAAAWVDGVLRLNPAFVLLAAAAGE